MMEERGLGTKATRADIIQKLYDRGYVFGNPPEPSETGIAMYKAFHQYVPRMATPEMTAELEKDMDQIAAGKTSKDEVLRVSREMLHSTTTDVEGQREDLAKVIWAGMDEDRILGPCRVCEEAGRNQEDSKHADPPAHAPAVVYLHVMSPDGRYAMLPNAYRYLDNTPPQITPYLEGTLGNNGWYTSDVSISWLVRDDDSPESIGWGAGCAQSWLRADSEGTTFTCTASSEGGSASASVTVKRDTRPPFVSMSTPQDTLYRVNQVVNASYSCLDSTPGLQDGVLRRHRAAEFADFNDDAGPIRVRRHRDRSRGIDWNRLAPLRRRVLDLPGMAPGARRLVAGRQRLS